MDAITPLRPHTIRKGSRLALLGLLALLATSVPAPHAQADLVRRCLSGGRLCVGSPGERPFFVKGHNFIPGRFIPAYHHAVPDDPVEYWTPLDIFTQDQLGEVEFRTKVKGELLEMKAALGINTVRIFTPALAAQFPEWAVPPYSDHWFIMDGPNAGEINPKYLARLKVVLELASELEMKVQLALLTQLHTEVYESPRQSDFWSRGLPAQPRPACVRKPAWWPSCQMPFYQRYLESLIPELLPYDSILAYEFDNENLIRDWEQQQTPDGGEFGPKMLDVLVRLIERLRALDSRHLVTTGEAIPVWPYAEAREGNVWWPSPELASLPNVGQHVPPGQSNDPVRIRLADFVDYISPHLYSREHAPASDDLESRWAELEQAIRDIREQYAGPLAFGEFGLRNASPVETPANYEADQDTLFRNLCEAALWYDASGLVVWTGVPPFRLDASAGQTAQYYLGEDGAPNWGLPYVVVRDSAGLTLRTIRHLYPSYTLFVNDGAVIPQTRLAAARSLAAFDPLNSSFLLWSREATGEASVWTLDSNRRPIRSRTLPIGQAGWRAMSLNRRDDGTTQLLWAAPPPGAGGTSVRASLQSFDPRAPREHHVTRVDLSATAGWAAQSFSQPFSQHAGKVVWSHRDTGASYIWSLSSALAVIGSTPLPVQNEWRAAGSQVYIEGGGSWQRLLMAQPGASQPVASLRTLDAADGLLPEERVYPGSDANCPATSGAWDARALRFGPTGGELLWSHRDDGSGLLWPLDAAGNCVPGQPALSFRPVSGWRTTFLTR